MINNSIRFGRFTSSEIVALTSNPTSKAKADGQVFGSSGLTYIQEKKFERRLQRSLNQEVFDRNLSWGKLCEQYVSQQANLLPLNYRVNMDKTTVHPEFDFWAGSEDASTDDSVCDFKSPKTLKSFCQLVEPLMLALNGTEAINHIRDNHKDGDKYYWQLVSNACIHGKSFGELIVYCPFKSELEAIREFASNIDGNQFEFQWIFNATDNELPYINDDGVYNNINFIRFEISETDKQFLTERVKQAKELL